MAKIAKQRKSRWSSIYQSSLAASSKLSDSEARMPSIEELVKQQIRSKWESPEDQRQRSAERENVENRERDCSRKEHFLYGHYGVRYDRDYDGKKVYERDYLGENRELFDDNKRLECPGYSRIRSPDRKNPFKGQQQQKRKIEPNRQRYDNKRNQNIGNKTYGWGKRLLSDNKDKKQGDDKDKFKPPVEKVKINFGSNAILTEDTNKENDIVAKYAEPPEARKPMRRWRLYPFKGETALPAIQIHRQSCFIVGRDRKVADLAVDHPSCSKQHAALQYRLVPFERDDGSKGKRVRLFVIDLDSTNGTFLNNQQIEPRKYYEFKEGGFIKFGCSTREYVLLHENSKGGEQDDEVSVKDEPEQKVDVAKQEQ